VTTRYDCRFLIQDEFELGLGVIAVEMKKAVDLQLEDGLFEVELSGAELLT